MDEPRAVTAVSRLTSKYQATIPRPAREALGLAPGDTVAFVVSGGRVWLRRALPFDREFARAAEQTLGEWQSAEDDEAYRDL